MAELQRDSAGEYRQESGSSSRAADSNVPSLAKETEVVANDSESNVNYLAKCCISIVGFEASEMEKLAAMVSKGGGSPKTSSTHKFKYMVIGNLTETEKNDVRSVAARGDVYVVNASWLQDCCREKTLLPVLPHHNAYNLLFPNAISGNVLKDHSNSLETDEVAVTKPESTNVFNGKTFCFSTLFPEERRAHIVELIGERGGEMISGQPNQSVDYTIECHGVKARSTAAEYESTYISSHWIEFCLKDGCLLDVDSHILYSPLPCTVPLPGFGSLHFCVSHSQYEEKDKALLLNLCKVLGAKFSVKLTKKVTHLLCKFTEGKKYLASCKLGIKSVTSEWIFECVKQNGVIPIDNFLPKKVPSIADTTEELLEEVSSKNLGQKSAGNTYDQSNEAMFSSYPCPNPHRADRYLGLPTHLFNRRNDDNDDDKDDRREGDSSSQSRTESQVVTWKHDDTWKEELMKKYLLNKKNKTLD